MVKNKRLLLILSISIMLILSFTVLNMFMSYQNIKESAQHSIANNSLEAAKSIAKSMDVEAYKDFLQHPVKDERYWEIRSYLNDAREKIGALYVYTLKVDNPKVSYGMIIGMPREDDIYPLGDPCTVPEEQVELAYQGETYYTDIIDDPTYGRYLSVGAPIHDETGEIIGYIGIDLSTEMIDQISSKVLKNNISTLVFSGLFVIILLLSFILIIIWYKKEYKREVVDTVDTFHEQFQSLMSSVQSLRHDQINHIQVIHGLLKIGNYEKLTEYVSDLVKDAQAIQGMKVDVANPALSILFQTKKLVAQNENIHMTISIIQENYQSIKMTDLIKILSNLIDNAIEATLELPYTERAVEVSSTKEGEYFMFEVKNTGPVIKDSTKLFKSGFSTKEAEGGKVRGQGLFIVKETVSKYNGEIQVESEAKQTKISVRIPVHSKR
ncbi:GHKL domain-containing protein [Bacillus sp. BGMRC 2118]|nr:GHKL domain-containing protein [Bacillus sp. BGMRC 2118]